MASLLVGLGASAGTVGTLAGISTIASPVLGVMGALSKASEAQAQKAEYTRQAQESRIMASVDAERMRRDARQKQSRDRTAMAEGGVLSGTSLGVLDQNAVAQELNALTVAFNGEQQARQAEFKRGQIGNGMLDVFSTAVKKFTQVDPLNL